MKYQSKARSTDQNHDKKRINRSKAGCNLDAIVTESEKHLIISRARSTDQKMDQN